MHIGYPFPSYFMLIFGTGPSITPTSSRAAASPAAQVFAAAVSEFDSKTYLRHHNPGATVPLFILYLFIVSIIMLNLLIALLTNSYEKVLSPCLPVSLPPAALLWLACMRIGT